MIIKKKKFVFSMYDAGVYRVMLVAKIDLLETESKREI